MSFDWMSFAKGFMDQTVITADKRAEEAKEYEKEQRLAAERNMEVIARRRAVADQISGYANYLQSNGVSDAQLQATIASGPQAIQALTQRVQQAVQANRGRPLVAADVAAIINMPEGFTPLDMTAQEFIDKTYGLSVTPSVTEEQEFSFLERLGGRDEMALAEERLNRTPIIEGMTIAEINRAAAQGDYRSLIPGTFASIVDAKADPYRLSVRAEVSADFMGELRTLLEDVKKSQVYRQAEVGSQERQNILEAEADFFIRRSIEQFGERFLADHTGFLELQGLSEGYVEGLVADFTSSEEAPTPERTATSPAPAPRMSPLLDSKGETPTDPTVQQTDEAFDLDRVATSLGVEGEVTAVEQGESGQPPTATSAATPEVVVTKLPPRETAPRAEDADIPDDLPVQPVPAQDAIVSVEDGGTFTYAEWEGMTRSQRRKAGLPTGLLQAQFYFNRFSAGITGERDLEFPEENRPVEVPTAPRAEDANIPDRPPAQPVPAKDAIVSVENGDTFTYADWEGMTRSQRRRAGLPTGLLQAQFYFNRFSAGITGDRDLEFPEENRTVEIPEEVQQDPAYRELSSAGVDDISIALLRSHGTDMLNFVQRLGARSDEELVVALSKWGQENSIVMPFDKSAIIYALKLVLDQE